MTRMDRLREYAGKPKGLQGAGRDEKNLAGWAARASENSEIAPRAKGPVHGAALGTHGEDAPSLPDTGKTMALRPTEAKPREQRKIDAAMSGRNDHNNVSSKGDYMPGVRREK
jgi:hypothetical protein